jgi:hypothetical protein
MQAIASTLRFLLELGLLAAVVYWGIVTQPGVLGWATGAAALAVVSLIWGIFISPRAPRRLRGVARLIPELVLFGLGALALALAAAGRPTIGLALFVAFVIDRLLLRLFGVGDWAPAD